MRLHMIGHASIAVETENCFLLADPVFWDPHGEGVLDIHPPREVILERLPAIDLLFVSHRHLDHFDIRSLAAIPKHIQVLIPEDPVIQRSLEALGFTKIECLEPFSEVRVGNTTLVTTHSNIALPEVGLLIADSSGVVWNMIDTVVTAETIGIVRKQVPAVDVLLAPWQPMLETRVQLNQPFSFPYEQYERLLQIVERVGPRAVIPAANGFCYREPAAWLNHVVFPVSRDQFCRDVVRTMPALSGNVFAMDPGDVMTLANGSISVEKGACPFVKRRAEPAASLEFRPTSVNAGIRYANPYGFDEREMRAVIAKEMTETLPGFLREHQDSLFAEHRRWELVYELEIHYADTVEHWTIDFAEASPTTRLAKASLPQFQASVVAPGLYGLITGRSGWDFLLFGGFYRGFSTLYRAFSQGLMKPGFAPVTDPLFLRFPEEEAFAAAREYEVQTWRS